MATEHSTPHVRCETAFTKARDTVRWAEIAIAELDMSAQHFFAAAPNVITEFDHKTDKKVRKVQLQQQLPKLFSRKTTEALNNIKNSFDQAMSAVDKLLPLSKCDLHYYPWSTNPSDLKGRLGRLEVDNRLWDTFESHEPYPLSDKHAGGDDVIRNLAKKVNDKHSIGLYVDATVSGVRYPHGKLRGVDMLKLHEPKWDPVKNEIKLISWIGDVESLQGGEVIFQIFFANFQPEQPVNAIDGLRSFTAKARFVIESLQFKCEEIIESDERQP
jgi:hypothetical protein